MVSPDPVLIGITGRPIAAGKVGASAAVGVGVGYLAALERAGAAPVVLSPQALDAASARALLQRVDGLLFLGGPDVDPVLYGGATHPTINGGTTSYTATNKVVNVNGTWTYSYLNSVTPAAGAYTGQVTYTATTP